jgi:NhaA family Na+:H+ antiporter
MLVLGRMGQRRLTVYMILAALLWYAMLLSGVHATIAGVLAALTIPIDKTPGTPDSAASPLHRLEHGLHPWVAFAIVPIFGFANAGVDVTGMTAAQIFAPMPLGIALGLFLGKQLGIFAAVWIAVKAGFGAKLRGATWLQIYGVGTLCGIGFTMSLFIGSLAFADPMLVEEAKIGTMMGSFASGLLGYAILRLCPQARDKAAEEREMAAEMRADGDVETMEADQRA